MDEYIKKQDKRAESAQLQALKRIFRVLQKSKSEVIGNLLSYPTDFERESLFVILKNIDLLMEELKVQLGSEYKSLVSESAKRGFDDQVRLVEAMYGSKIKDIETNLLFGSSELRVFTVLEENVDSFLGRFTGDLREKIKNTIQLSFLHGRSEGETVEIIKTQYDTQLAPTKRAVHHIYQTSYNIANQDVLEELHKTVPSLQKQWYSQLDKKTTTPCRNLHNQVKPVNEPFIEPQSQSKFMYPPACFGNPEMHPQFHFCRSRAIPFIEEYKDL